MRLATNAGPGPVRSRTTISVHALTPGTTWRTIARSGGPSIARLTDLVFGRDWSMNGHGVATHALGVAPPRKSLLRAGSLLVSLLLCLAMAAPASAAKPTRGCTKDFVLMTRDEFIALSLSVGVPPELLGTPEWVAGWVAYDRNHDDQLCVKDLPNTPGHLDSWIFNVVDNTSNH